MYDLIYELIRSGDLLEANTYLKQIDAALDAQTVNRSAFCKQLAQALTEWTYRLRNKELFVYEISKYYIFTDWESIPYYLAFSGLSLGRVREVRRYIKDQIAYINETIIEPTGNCITVDTEKKVMSILEAKYPFFEVAATKNPLHILNINNTNRIYNSTTGCSESSVPLAVHMYNMKDSDTAPEYVFLHELGHVLQASLTNSVLYVPDEFIQLHNTIPSARRLEQGNPDAPEVFADTFAVAVMRGTELSCYDPFNFPEALNEVLEKFYKKLFEKYRRANTV